MSPATAPQPARSQPPISLLGRALVALALGLELVIPLALLRGQELRPEREATTLGLVGALLLAQLGWGWCCGNLAFRPPSQAHDPRLRLAAWSTRPGYFVLTLAAHVVVASLILHSILAGTVAPPPPPQPPPQVESPQAQHEAHWQRVRAELEGESEAQRMGALGTLCGSLFGEAFGRPQEARALLLERVQLESKLATSPRTRAWIVLCASPLKLDELTAQRCAAWLQPRERASAFLIENLRRWIDKKGFHGPGLSAIVWKAIEDCPEEAAEHLRGLAAIQKAADAAEQRIAQKRAAHAGG